MKKIASVFVGISLLIAANSFAQNEHRVPDIAKLQTTLANNATRGKYPRFEMQADGYFYEESESQSVYLHLDDFLSHSNGKFSAEFEKFLPSYRPPDESYYFTYLTDLSNHKTSMTNPDQTISAAQLSLVPALLESYKKPGRFSNAPHAAEDAIAGAIWYFLQDAHPKVDGALRLTLRKLGDSFRTTLLAEEAYLDQAIKKGPPPDAYPTPQHVLEDWKSLRGKVTESLRMIDEVKAGSGVDASATVNGSK